MTPTAFTPLNGTQPATVAYAVRSPQPEVLRDASRRLSDLLQTVGQHESDGAALSRDEGSESLQLTIACVTMVTCAAAVHAAAQQAGSVVPEQWAAVGLAKGAPRAVTWQALRCNCAAAAMHFRSAAGSLGAALQRLGPSLSEMTATQEGFRIVSLVEQLVNGLVTVTKLSNSHDLAG